MRYALLSLLPLFFCQMAFSQKFLQLERLHSPKTRKFFPGDEVTFQMGGQWYTRVIEDISYDQKLIIFAKGAVHVDSIMALRSFKPRSWSRPIGNQLYNFAIAWTGFTLISAAVDDDDQYTRGDAAVAVSSAATGFLLQRLFRQRTFRMEKNNRGEPKKWRLRVLDLNVERQKGG